MRDAQTEPARAYGVTAFCYHHYWFIAQGCHLEPDQTNGTAHVEATA